MRHSLVVRILLLVGVVGSVSLMGMGWFAIHHMESGLMSENRQQLGRLIDSTSRGLQTIMLAGYADIAQAYAHNLKEMEGLLDFSIMRTSGQEAFLDNKTIDNVNRRRGEEEFMPRPTERVVEILPRDHASLQQALASGKPVSYAEHSAAGLRQETYLVPILNQKECYKCHGGDHTVRGVIKLTTSLAGVDQAIQDTRMQMLGVLLVTISAFLLLLGFVLRQGLGRPMGRISRALADMINGNLVDRLTVDDRRDEVAVIAIHINALADNLAHNIRTINLHAGSISAFVREILNLRGALGQDSNNLRSISAAVEQENQILDQEITAIGQRIVQAAGRMAEVTRSAEEVSAGLLTMAQSAQKADDEVATMAAAADQMAARVQSVNQSLGRVDHASRAVSREVEEMRLSLEQVRQQCQSTSRESDTASRRAQDTLKVTDDLSQAAREIGRAVTLIKDIADRTNLLALNAAIEAALAGEMGQGFGVVAVEVKELSKQTMEATRTISGLVEGIQAKTRNAAVEVGEITTLVAAINQANQEIAGAVDEQTQSIGRMAGSAQDVAKATAAVMDDAQEMANTAQQVDQAAGRAANSASEIVRLSANSAQAADHMRHQSEEASRFSREIQESVGRTETASQVVREKIADSLAVVQAMQGSVNHFRSLGDVASNISDALLAAQSNLDVGPEPFDVRLMKEVHLKLLGRLERAANGHEPLSLEEVMEADTCPLGVWIREQGPAMIQDGKLLDHLRDTHHLTHSTAREVVTFLAGGHRHAAVNAVRFFHVLRTTLFDQLNQIYIGETGDTGGDEPWMAWEDKYLLGIPAMDEDHHRLVDLVNRLTQAHRNNEGSRLLLQLLEELLTACREHFQREERMMEQHRYPELARHQLEHQNLLAKAGDFLQKIRHENQVFSFEMAIYLKNWLSLHVQGEDTRYVRFVQKKGET